jgi:hypothetical protein
MRLLTEVIAQTTTTGGADGGGGFDWEMALGLPAAISSAIGLAAYGVGVIRPLSIKRPRYWHTGGTTRLSCIVMNRSLLYDRTVSSLSLVEARGWVKRTFWPFWKRSPQTPRLIVWNASGFRTLGKRDEVELKAELHEANVPGTFDPSRRSRLLAHAGSKTSRGARLKKLSG